MIFELCKQTAVHVLSPLAEASSDSVESSPSEDHPRMSIRKILWSRKALHKQIEDLEQLLRLMRNQRAELEGVMHTVNRWSAELRGVERTNLGVPYIRAVKCTLGELKDQLYVYA